MSVLMTKETIEECPHCGGKMFELKDYLIDPKDNRPFYWVECRKCGACGGPSKDGHKAIMLWNMRVGG